MSNYYPKYILWSKEERCWIGRCPVFDQEIMVKGKDELSVFKSLRKALDQHLDKPEPEKYCLENIPLGRVR